MRGIKFTPPLPSDIAVAKANSCEEETDAGGRIPSSPQMEALLFRATAEYGGGARNSSAHGDLGVSGASEKVPGGRRGGVPLGLRLGPFR